jgi:hypothetical protein
LKRAVTSGLPVTALSAAARKVSVDCAVVAAAAANSTMAVQIDLGLGCIEILNLNFSDTTSRRDAALARRECSEPAAELEASRTVEAQYFTLLSHAEA